jgi:hypothetical protein
MSTFLQKGMSLPRPKTVRVGMGHSPFAVASRHHTFFFKCDSPAEKGCNRPTEKQGLTDWLGAGPGFYSVSPVTGLKERNWTSERVEVV